MQQQWNGDASGQGQPQGNAAWQGQGGAAGSEDQAQMMMHMQHQQQLNWDQQGSYAQLNQSWDQQVSGQQWSEEAGESGVRFASCPGGADPYAVMQYGSATAMAGKGGNGKGWTAGGPGEFDPVFCKFFNAGECLNGITCPYVHDTGNDGSPPGTIGVDEFAMDKTVAGFVIGAKGGFVQKILEVSGCQVKVAHDNTGQSDFSVIQLWGDRQQRLMARAMIQTRQMSSRSGGKSQSWNWKDKPKKAPKPYNPEDEDPLYNAIEVALQSAGHSDDDGKVSKKIRKYLTGAAKHINYGKKSVTWQNLVSQYSQNFYQTLFQNTIEEYPWVKDLDFAFMVSVAVREVLPEKFLAGVEQTEFANGIRQAVEKAAEEQRALPLIWDTLKEKLSGGKRQNKTYAALEAARAEVLEKTLDTMEDFVAHLIEGTISRVAETTNDQPYNILPEEEAADIFNGLLEHGALPLNLTPIPPEGGWEDFIKAVLRDRYKPFDSPEEELKKPETSVEPSVALPSIAKGKGGKGYGKVGKTKASLTPASGKAWSVGKKLGGKAAFGAPAWGKGGRDVWSEGAWNTGGKWGSSTGGWDYESAVAAVAAWFGGKGGNGGEAFWEDAAPVDEAGGDQEEDEESDPWAKRPRIF